MSVEDPEEAQAKRRRIGILLHIISGLLRCVCAGCGCQKCEESGGGRYSKAMTPSSCFKCSSSSPLLTSPCLFNYLHTYPQEGGGRGWWGFLKSSGFFWDKCAHSIPRLNYVLVTLAGGLGAELQVVALKSGNTFHRECSQQLSWQRGV